MSSVASRVVVWAWANEGRAKERERRARVEGMIFTIIFAD
jgi:hypothetical protein